MYDNKNLVLRIILVVLGLTLIALSVTEVLASPVYAGLGGMLAAVGILQVIHILRYRKDREYRAYADTEENDERNRFLKMKSWSLAGNIAFLLEGIGVVVAAILGQRTVQLVLTCSAGLLLVLYLISLVLLNKKY